MNLVKHGSNEEGVVDAMEVNYLEGEWLLAEVVWLAEGDIEPDAPKGHDFHPWHNPIEWCLARAQAVLRDAHLVKGAGIEYVEATPPIHQHLGDARGTHDRANDERVAPQMTDAVGVIFLVKGDGRLGPLEPHRGSKGVDSVHLLLGDVALPVGLICLGASEDHEAALGLGEPIVFLLGTVRQVAGLQGRLLGLALLVEGTTDVALYSSAVLKEVPGLTFSLKLAWTASSPMAY